MSRAPLLVALCLVVGVVGACSGSRQAGSGTEPPAPREWFGSLTPLCGKAYPGRVRQHRPREFDPAWQESPLVLFLRSCQADGMVMQVARGTNRSLSLLLAPHDDALYLRHVVHGSDGRPADLTGYGGMGRSVSADGAIEFKPDEHTQGLFAGYDLEQRLTAVWTLRLHDGVLTYEDRWQGGLVRIEFDLSDPVPAPEASWFEQPIR